MKDIFIDTNIAARFANPNEHYQQLIAWLKAEDPQNPQNNAYLLISDHLRREYQRTNSHCKKGYSIITIYSYLQARGRLNAVSNDTIEQFKREYISKRQWGKFLSNDKDHIPLVLCSVRKYVLSEDTKFLTDLINFPKFGKDVMYGQSPELLDYT
jgi:hypothetical protein